MHEPEKSTCMQKHGKNERMQEDRPIHLLNVHFLQMSGSFLAFFHVCLVSVLFSGPSLTEMKFHRNFSVRNSLKWPVNFGVTYRAFFIALYFPDLHAERFIARFVDCVRESAPSAILGPTTDDPVLQHFAELILGCASARIIRLNQI